MSRERITNIKEPLVKGAAWLEYMRVTEGACLEDVKSAHPDLYRALVTEGVAHFLETRAERAQRVAQNLATPVAVPVRRPAPVQTPKVEGVYTVKVVNTVPAGYVRRNDIFSLLLDAGRAAGIERKLAISHGHIEKMIVQYGEVHVGVASPHFQNNVCRVAVDRRSPMWYYSPSFTKEILLHFANTYRSKTHRTLTADERTRLVAAINDLPN